MPLTTMTERYIWTVLYNDGTVCHEYPDPNTHQRFEGERAGDIVLLALKPNHWLGIMGGQEYVVSCNPEDGEQAIMFRRVVLNTQTGETLRWHVCGKQITVRGKKTQVLIYIPDGSGPILFGDENTAVI